MMSVFNILFNKLWRRHSHNNNAVTCTLPDLKFKELLNHPLKKILTPRVQLTWASIDLNFEELTNIFKHSDKSVVFVFKKQWDQCVGWISKDIICDIFLQSKTEMWTCYIQPLPQLPLAATAQQIFVLFATQKSDIVGIVDEFGGLNGVVYMSHLFHMMHQLVERFEKKIAHEHDDASAYACQSDQKTSEHRTLLLSGSCPLTILQKQLNIGVEVFPSHIKTLGAWLVNMQGGQILKGQVISGPARLNFHIIDCDAYRIRKVAVKLNVT